jgi:hypothetical protein
MRWKAIIVLAAIILSIAIPTTVFLTGIHGGQAAIGTLDVCHSATPALFSNGDMPCVNECAFNAHLLAQSMISDIFTPPCKPFFITFQDEHPPKS